MRKQIERISLAMTMSAVGAGAGVALYLGISNVQELQQHQVQMEAGLIANHVAARLAEGKPIDVDYLTQFVLHEVSVRVTAPGVDVSLRRAGMSDVFWAEATLDEIKVRVGHDDRRLRSEVFSLVQSAAVIAALLMLLVWGFARIWGSRLQRVFDQFVEEADRLGSGDVRPVRREYGLEELNTVSRVLERSARRIQDLLVVERRLVAEASHQLRTPMTALSLQLEELIDVADDPAAVRAGANDALRQIGRMTSAMEELIAVRRGQESAGPPQVLAVMLSDVIDEAAASLAVTSRELVVRIPKGVETRTHAGALRHIVSILLENALEHGRGKVTLTAEATEDWVVVAVGDEGAGLDVAAAQLLMRSDRGVDNGESVSASIGLPLAKALATAQGGRLEWREAERAVVRVYLPVSE